MAQHHGLFNYCNGVLKCHSISELNGHIVNELIILLVDSLISKNRLVKTFLSLICCLHLKNRAKLGSNNPEYC